MKLLLLLLLLLVGCQHISAPKTAAPVIQDDVVVDRKVVRPKPRKEEDQKLNHTLIQLDLDLETLRSFGPASHHH